MFYYQETINEKNILDEHFVLLWKEMIGDTNEFYLLLETYLYHSFHLLNEQEKELMLRMSVAQLNAYECISTLYVQENNMDEWETHRPSFYTCPFSDEQSKIHRFHDFVGLLLFLKNQEVQRIEVFERLIKRCQNDEIKLKLIKCVQLYQQCLFTINHLLEARNHPDGCKIYDPLEGNYFDPKVPYYVNLSKK